MSRADRNTKAEPGFIKRRNRISGQFAPRLIEMLESPPGRNTKRAMNGYFSQSFSVNLQTNQYLFAKSSEK